MLAGSRMEQPDISSDSPTRKCRNSFENWNKKIYFYNNKTLSSVLMRRRSKLLEQFPQSNNIHFYLSQQIEVWVITPHFSIKIYIFSSSISQSKDVQETVIMIPSLIKPGLRHLLLTKYLFLDLATIIFASTERWTIMFDLVFTREKKYIRHSN